MPKVTYQEYRPGRWVKLVDGKAVGPATAEEVDRWRREQAAQARIWQDVVKKAQATPAPPKPERSTRRSRKPADTEGIWQDVVGQARVPPSEAAPQADAEPPEPPPGTIEEAIRSARHGKPVPVRSGKVVDPGEPAHAAVRAEPPLVTTPAEEAPPPDLDRAPPSAARSTRDTGAPVTREPPKAVEKAPPAPAPPAITRKAKASATPSARAGKARTAGMAAPSRPAGTPKAGRDEEAAQREPGPEAPASQEPSKAKHAARAQAPAVTRPSEPAVSDELLETELVLPDEPSHREPDETTQAVPATAKPASRCPHESRTRRRASPAPAAAEVVVPSYLWIVAGPGDDLPAVVRTGLARYEERFQEAAGAILCHEADVPVLEAAKLDVDVRHREGLAPRNFWIGSK